MSTPADEEARSRLRTLKEQRDQADGLYDRFGDEQFARAARDAAAEIAKLPPHILQADEIETKLQALTYAVEDYIIARAAQFLPDVDDLWAAVQALQPEEKPDTPAETPVIRLMSELRTLGASEADIEKAVTAAASLEGHRNPGVYPRLSAAGKPNGIDEHKQALNRQISEFLTKQPQTNDGQPIRNDGDLIYTVNQWQRDQAEPVDQGEKQGTFWTRYYSGAILSAIAVLHKLGMSDTEIQALIREAYSQWRTRKY